MQILLLQGKKICQKSALGAVAQHAVGSADPVLCPAASGHGQRVDIIWQEKARQPQSQQNRGCGLYIVCIEPSSDILLFTKLGIISVDSSPNQGKKDLDIDNS